MDKKDHCGPDRDRGERARSHATDPPIAGTVMKFSRPRLRNVRY